MHALSNADAEQDASINATILVAEDHLDSRDALRALLEAFGYRVIEAVNGRDAIEKALTQRPDLILMDIMMPEMDGFEATRQLRGHTQMSGTPIIAVTAMEGAHQLAIQAGANDYVRKPVDIPTARRESARLAASAAAMREPMGDAPTPADRNEPGEAPLFEPPPSVPHDSRSDDTERHVSESPLDDILRTWREASLEPRHFFGALPARAALGPAIIYYLVLGIAVEGAQLFWSMIFRAAGISGSVFGMVENDTAWGPIIDFLLSPLLLLLSLFIAAGVTHLLLRMLGGATRNYGFTVRVFAFAYSPQILGIIPVVGQIVGFVWMVVVATIGLSAGHRTSTGRAAAAVLIPVAIGLMFVAIAAMLAAAGTLLLPG